MKLIENCNAIDYVLEEKDRTLLHVVNDKKVMGSGIALEIKNRIPSAYTNYLEEDNHFGCITFSDGCKVINLGAQKGYGRNKRHLNYGALSHCIGAVWRYANVRALASNEHFTGKPVEIVVPYLMGCDRAGGDWEVVLEVLDFYFKGNLTICKL